STSGFGNLRGIDIWAYYPGAQALLGGGFSIKQADLQITKAGPASITPGNTISYTLIVTNNGPSDVVGASVIDTFPASLTGATWTASITSGTGAVGAPSGSGNINTTVDLTAGSQATYVISNVLVGFSAGVTVTNSAM